MVDFSDNRQNAETAADRYEPEDRISFLMDMTAADGMNGNRRIDWDALLSADDFTFRHDCSGIIAHMDRETGRLQGGFTPRCAMKPRRLSSALDEEARRHMNESSMTPEEAELAWEAIEDFLCDVSDRALLEELANRNEVGRAPSAMRLDPDKNQEFTVGIGRDHTATVLLHWGADEELTGGE